MHDWLVCQSNKKWFLEAMNYAQSFLILILLVLYKVALAVAF